MTITVHATDVVQHRHECDGCEEKVTVTTSSNVAIPPGGWRTIVRGFTFHACSSKCEDKLIRLSKTLFRNMAG